MESGDANKLKQLEDENRKVKHVVAELTLDNRAFFAVSCALHLVLLSWVWENSHSRWSSFRGLGQEHYNAGSVHADRYGGADCSSGADAGRDLPPCGRLCAVERIEERIKTGTEQMGRRLQTVEKEMVGTWGLEPQTSTVSS